MIKLYVLTVIVYANLGGNEAGLLLPNHLALFASQLESVPGNETIAKLDFWAPDPKFYARRMHETTQKIEKKMKFGYNKSDIRLNTRRTESQNASHKYRSLPKHVRDIEHQRRKKPTEPKALRSDDVGKDSWPKRVRPRSRQQIEDPSTRLTPMYLMQRDPNEADATTHKTTADDSDPMVLSPYALEKQMKEILSRYPDVNSSTEVIGRTVEYNDIILVKMSQQKTDIGKYFRADENKYIDEVPEKKIVFIVHCLSVLGAKNLEALTNEQYFKTLLGYYMSHLDMFDIFLIPLANPDGYAAAGEKSFWNKNMSPQSDCYGVALDRNFDVSWNTEKKYSPCSQLYPGPAPFSEAETRAVRDVLHHYGHKIIAYIHLHPGTHSSSVFKGDAVLYPKGYSEVQSDDDKYIDLKGDIEEAMKNASFQVMTVAVDTLHNWYGKVFGTSVDYASTVYGIPYALEFVMQIYQSIDAADSIEDLVDHNALTEIWGRIIPVVFHNIWRSIHANDMK